MHNIQNQKLKPTEKLDKIITENKDTVFMHDKDTLGTLTKIEIKPIENPTSQQKEKKKIVFTFLNGKITTNQEYIDFPQRISINGKLKIYKKK
jgi:hypothetical protein